MLKIIASLVLLAQMIGPGRTSFSSSAPVTAVLPTSNLIRHYVADSISPCSGTFSSWVDSSAHSNLTPINSPTCSTNQIGSHNGVMLNGTNQVLAMEAAISSTPVSLYFVVKPSTRNTSDGNYLWSGSGGSSLSGGVDASGHLVMDKEYVVNLVSGSTVVSTGSAIEFAFINDGTTASVYINGVLDGSAGHSQAFTPFDTIGANYSSGNFYVGYWNGSITDVAIYSVGTYNAAVHAYYHSVYGI